MKIFDAKIFGKTIWHFVKLSVKFISVWLLLTLFQQLHKPMRSNENHLPKNLIVFSLKETNILGVLG